MMPYINPNYFNQPQYNSMYQMPNNNYQNQMQNQMSNQMQSQLKVVDSIDVVKATDIPMDGQTYYFPKADGSIVYSKKWLPNGTTQITSYEPHIDVLEPKADTLSPKALESQNEAIRTHIERIEESIATLNDKIDKFSKPARAKKEVDNE